MPIYRVTTSSISSQQTILVSHITSPLLQGHYKQLVEVVVEEEEEVVVVVVVEVGQVLAMGLEAAQAMGLVPVVG
ncbi:hypothetical protein OIU78_006200 [Salix suchowensis]|nr:hypothetical protein OIU78_006200 [Salix suchowensis]